MGQVAGDSLSALWVERSKALAIDDLATARRATRQIAEAESQDGDDLRVKALLLEELCEPAAMPANMIFRPLIETLVGDVLRAVSGRLPLPVGLLFWLTL
jgi:hypothetical protein